MNGQEEKTYKIMEKKRRYYEGDKDIIIYDSEQLRFEAASVPGKYTLKDALAGLPIIGTNPHKLNTDYESEQNGYAIRKIITPRNEFINNINHNLDINYILNHKSRYNNENDLEIFALLPEGQNSLHQSVRHLIKYKNRDHIFKDKYFKL